MAEPVGPLTKLRAHAGAFDERFRAVGAWQLRWFLQVWGARPLFARAPKGRSLLPYKEGKAASSFTVIGSPACTVFRKYAPIRFFVLKILNKFSMPSARVFGEQRNQGVRLA